MAIIIPSKRIYETNNNKIVDNNIANVNYQENIFTYNVKELYTNDNAINNFSEYDSKIFEGEYGVGEENNKRTRFRLVGCSFQKYTISTTIGESIREGAIKVKTIISSNGDLDDDEYIMKKKGEDEPVITNIPAPIPFDEEYNEIIEFVNKQLLDNLRYDYEISNNGLTISLNFYILQRIQVLLITEELINGIWQETTAAKTVTDISLYGLKIDAYADYSSSSSTVVTKGKTGLSYQLDDNELLQKDTTYEDEGEAQTIGAYISDQILSAYENGKETAILRCSINDYYDESGEKVIDISTNRMSFRINDIVLPMVYKATYNSKTKVTTMNDCPMSNKNDGNPKYFIVLGSEIYYDGAVWQKIYLQEA